MMDISGRKRTIVVTGAARGLGRAIALRFGMTGGRIAVNYAAHATDAEETAASIVVAGGDAMVFQADVRRPSEVRAMMLAVVQKWGTIDILVNNAGITADGLLIRMSEQDWDSVIDTNVKGPFLCTQAAAEIMKTQGSGHIINISSIVGIHGREGQANYASSKAALIGMTKSCARELGSSGIQVNAVLPGYLQTAMGSTVSPAVQDRIVREHTLGRPSTPGEVADFVHHLSWMKNVSGQVFNLDSRIV